MTKIVHIRLSGYPTLFQADDAAYETLNQYLERARARLRADPDREEVLRDLEQSIAEKLAVVASGVEVLGVGDVKAVLEEVGAVEGDKTSDFVDAADQRPKTRRRLYRIKEGQQIAGVCQGLAAYSSIPVGWIQFGFMVLAASTAGVGILVYGAMALWLPVVSTHKEYLAITQTQAA